MQRILTTFTVIVLCLGLTAAFVLGKSQSRTSNSESKAAKNEKASKTAWLGVMTQTVDEDIADAFEVNVDYGAIVNEVIDDSPAKSAGLKEGDVIISFNGKKIWDQHDLTDFIEDSPAGSKAALGIMRNNKEMTIDVELGSRPAGASWSSRNNRTPGAYLFSGPDDMRVFNWGKGSYIGVQLSELTDQLGKYFGVSDGEGVLITEVNEDSPAEKAGLQAGDVIVAINDQNVSDYGAVKEIISDSDEGDQLNISIIRNKKKQSVNVTVEESDESNNAFGYQLFNVPPVPNVPDIDVRVPRIRGNFNRNNSSYFDYESYQKDMELFKADMEKYKEEMKALSKDMNNLKGTDQEKLEREIEELRSKLRELEKKIQ